MNPDPNPTPNRNNPNNLLDTITLLGYNVRIECIYSNTRKPRRLGGGGGANNFDNHSMTKFNLQYLFNHKTIGSVYTY